MKNDIRKVTIALANSHGDGAGTMKSGENIARKGKAKASHPLNIHDGMTVRQQHGAVTGLGLAHATELDDLPDAGKSPLTELPPEKKIAGPKTHWATMVTGDNSLADRAADHLAAAGVGADPKRRHADVSKTAKLPGHAQCADASGYPIRKS